MISVREHVHWLEVHWLEWWCPVLLALRMTEVDQVICERGRVTGDIHYLVEALCCAQDLEYRFVEPTSWRVNHSHHFFASEIDVLNLNFGPSK
jgi:hypothetical protein